MRGALFGDELSLPNASPTSGLWRSRIPIRSMHQEGVCLVKREFYSICFGGGRGCFALVVAGMISIGRDAHPGQHCSSLKRRWPRLSLDGERHDVRFFVANPNRLGRANSLADVAAGEM